MPLFCTAEIPSHALIDACTAIRPRPFVPGAVVGVGGSATHTDGTVEIAGLSVLVVGPDGRLVEEGLSRLLAQEPTRVPLDILVAFAHVAERGTAIFAGDDSLACEWEESHPNRGYDVRGAFILAEGVLFLDTVHDVHALTLPRELAARCALWTLPATSAHATLASAQATQHLHTTAKRMLNPLWASVDPDTPEAFGPTPPL